jgi:hypothetical protein
MSFEASELVSTRTRTLRTIRSSSMLSTPASLGIEETSASFEARSAPRSYPTFVDQFPASGSSWKSFARGGEAVTIRDSPVKKVSKVAPRSVLGGLSHFRNMTVGCFRFGDTLG